MAQAAAATAAAVAAQQVKQHSGPIIPGRTQPAALQTASLPQALHLLNQLHGDVVGARGAGGHDRMHHRILQRQPVAALAVNLCHNGSGAMVQVGTGLPCTCAPCTMPSCEACVHDGFSRTAAGEAGPGVFMPVLHMITCYALHSMQAAAAAAAGSAAAATASSPWATAEIQGWRCCGW